MLNAFSKDNIVNLLSTNNIKLENIRNLKINEQRERKLFSKQKKVLKMTLNIKRKEQCSILKRTYRNKAN